MATFTRKDHTVEAKQFVETGTLMVISRKCGEQVARTGDYLVTDPASVEENTKQEELEGIDLGGKGTIYVVSKADFERDFDVPVIEEIAPVIEPVEPVVEPVIEPVVEPVVEPAV